MINVKEKIRTIQAILADSLTHLSRTSGQPLTAAARGIRGRTRGRARLAGLTTAIAVTSIAGAAALAVNLPDPTHTATPAHRAATTHGHTPTQRLTGPRTPPAHSSGRSHAPSGAS